MKVTAFVLPVVLVAIGFSTSQAGLFDGLKSNLLDRLDRLRSTRKADERGPKATAVADCEPGKKLREVVKQPCESTLHTYQRQTARPLPTGSRRCAKPPKPIAECETAAEAAAVAQRVAAISIARLIFQSQTSCYASDRRAAIHRLGDGYDCSKNPEILVAFVYALNDADESVRSKAADEIGDQVGQHPDCAAPEVIAALKVALGDCDKRVRREVRQALDACRIDVVRVRDGSCVRPAAECAPKSGTPLKKPGYEKPATAQPKTQQTKIEQPKIEQPAAEQPFGEVAEVAEAVAAEQAADVDEKPAATRGLPRLIEYIKSLK